jgi:GNAT superfamily N-acetyltransferase
VPVYARVGDMRGNGRSTSYGSMSNMQMWLKVQQALDMAAAIDDEMARTLIRIRGGAGVLDGEVPLVFDANHLRIDDVRGWDVYALLQKGDEILGGVGLRYREVVLFDGRPEAESIVRELEACGWVVNRHVLMVLPERTELLGDPDLKVKEVGYRDIEAVQAAAIRAEAWADDRVTEQVVIRNRRVATVVDEQCYAVFEGVQPVSCCRLFVRAGVSQVENVATLETYRDRGLARAVVSRAVSASRARGATTVFLFADADEWPRQMYGRWGFVETVMTYHLHQCAWPGQ